MFDSLLSTQQQELIVAVIWGLITLTVLIKVFQSITFSGNQTSLYC